MTRSPLLAALAAALLLSACGGPSPQLLSRPSSKPDPFARLRGHEAYGLVTALGPTDVVPDMRSTERCKARDEVCEVLLSEGGRYQYAEVRLSATLGFDKMVVIKGQAQVGDIVRFSMPIDPKDTPMAVEIGNRAAKRKGSTCDWIDGTPETRTGGVACKGWSYRDAAATPR